MKKLTSQNFDEIVSKQKGLFLIKFFSPTCGPCQMMTPVMEALDKNNPSVDVFEIDTSVSPELASHFGVRGVPFIAFCEKRELLYSFTGLTSLGDMQYVIDNIDDEYFREHGEFSEAPKQKDWIFITAVISVVIFLVLILVFA